MVSVFAPRLITEPVPAALVSEATDWLVLTFSTEAPAPAAAAALPAAAASMMSCVRTGEVGSALAMFAFTIPSPATMLVMKVWPR